MYRCSFIDRHGRCAEPVTRVVQHAWSWTYTRTCAKHEPLFVAMAEHQPVPDLSSLIGQRVHINFTNIRRS